MYRYISFVCFISPSEWLDQVDKKKNFMFKTFDYLFDLKSLNLNLKINKVI